MPLIDANEGVVVHAAKRRFFFLVGAAQTFQWTRNCF